MNMRLSVALLAIAATLLADSGEAPPDIQFDYAQTPTNDRAAAIWKASLEAAGFTVESADTPMVSDNLVPVTSVEDAKKVLRIMEAIEDNDDVQDVYSNFDIADEVMEAAAG